jgi:hypothetical protein
MEGNPVFRALPESSALFCFDMLTNHAATSVVFVVY